MLDFQHILLLYLKNYYNISFYLIISVEYNKIKCTNRLKDGELYDTQQ